MHNNYKKPKQIEKKKHYLLNNKGALHARNNY